MGWQDTRFFESHGPHDDTRRHTGHLTSSLLILGALRRTRLALCAVIFVMVATVPASAAGSSPMIGAAGSVVPQLILIHGGSFLYEDPSFEPLTRARAAQAGFVPHYLRYPLGDMPDAYRAARAEVIRLRARYGDDVYAYGSSAGGTLAALLAGDGLVSAAVAKAPVSDLLDWRWPLSAYGPDYFERIGLAAPAARRRLSPLRRSARRPLLILQGRADRVVPPAMSRAYSVRFKRVYLWEVPGGHHTERTRPELLSRAFDWLARVANARRH
jgi:pimeloyl-ACP methyl ester carboxylesterase